MYFDHHFRSESPIFHVKILSECIKSRFFAVAAPRGSAKSTIICFLDPAHAICFKKKRHIVICQNTYAKSAGSLDTIKSEFRENIQLKKDFGIEIIKDREGDSIFKHPDGFKTRVLCKGAEQIGSIRGEKFGAYRPDLIIVDDLEADEQVANREVRDALLEKYKDALEPAIDSDIGSIHVVGTILHEDSLMKKLVTTDIFKQYRKLLYKARYVGKSSGETLSLWPEKWSVDQLNEMEREEPSKFAKEYQNDPVSGMMSNFDRGDFRYWYIENNDYVLLDKEDNIISRGELSGCKCAVSCDLAWDEKKRDDDTVLMPAYFTPNSDILIDEYIAEKGLKPDKFIEYIFPMVNKLEKNTGKKCLVGFEKGKLEKVMRWFLKKEERIRNIFLSKRDLLWDSDKITRIVTRLQSRYKNHVIYHRKGMGDLEHQLLQVPSGKHDDLCFEKGTKISTKFGLKNIEDIKVGDKVITPFGLKRIINCGWTGQKETINLFGMNLTHNHKVFNKEKSCFVSADTIKYSYELNKISYKELIKWRYLKLLNLMEKSTKEWVGRESIIYLNQKVIKEGSVLKDFMLQFMKNIGMFRFKKAFMFTILMVIHLIMILKILSVFQLVNIIGGLETLIKNQIKDSWRKLGIWLQNGIKVKREGNGIRKTVEIVGNQEVFISSNAIYVRKNLNQKSVQLNHVHKDVEIKRKPLKDVYNLTVEEDSVYYADGFLVSNCDAEQGIVQLFQVEPGRRKVKQTEDKDEGFEWLQKNALINKTKVKKPFMFGTKSKLFALPARKTFR